MGWLCPRTHRRLAVRPKNREPPMSSAVQSLLSVSHCYCMYKKSFFSFFSSLQDLSDAQWREFRGAAPALAAAFAAFAALSRLVQWRAARQGPSQHDRLVFCVACAAAYLMYLHGACAAFVFGLVALNWAVAQNAAGRPWGYVRQQSSYCCSAWLILVPCSIHYDHVKTVCEACVGCIPYFQPFPYLN